MPDAGTMRNTFTHMRTSFCNMGIWAIVTDYLQFRVQLLDRNEFTSQTGWNDALNGYLKRELEKLAETVKRATYSPSGSDPDSIREDRIADAKDTCRKLSDAFDGRSINADDLVMPSTSSEFHLNIDLSGQHPDHPQPTPGRIKNDWARNFITLLDTFAVKATNLDSASQPATINAPEAAQLLAYLNSAYAICHLKGGEANRSDVPTGLLPSEVPSTFNAGGEHDVPIEGHGN